MNDLEKRVAALEVQVQRLRKRERIGKLIDCIILAFICGLLIKP